MRLALAIAALAAVLLLAPAADAKRRSVPYRFMGVNWDGAIAQAPGGLQANQFPKMAAAGVETMRVAFSWSRAQPQEDGPIDLSVTDRLVERAAARRIEVFPHVILAPAWARMHEAPLAPPRDPELFRPYVHALVDRYGPRGSFWRAHPNLPRIPIRYWQFWNEPHLAYQWTVGGDTPWAKTYVDQLRVFSSAVKERDPRAKVVLAGLTNESWVYLQQLYEDGVHGAFDLATVHPYTSRASGVAEIVRRFRAVMKRYGDGRKPLWVTELGLPASRGRSKSRNKLQTTDRGMAEFLGVSYMALAERLRRPAYGATRVYWYTWASPYRGDIFRFTGLFRFRAGGKPQKRQAFGAYVRTARRLEGCVKRSTGRCR